MNECAHKGAERLRIGPDSDEMAMILVDHCLRCGVYLAVHPETLTPEQGAWLALHNLEMAMELANPVALRCDVHGLDNCPTCGQHVPDGVKLPGEE